MTVADAIAQLPDDTRVSVTIGGHGPTMAELRAALVSSGPALLSTTQASAKYGWKPKYWALLAPKMPGAFNDGRWHLPVEGCEAHVAAKRRKSRRRFVGTAAPAPTTPTRPTGLQKGKR